MKYEVYFYHIYQVDCSKKSEKEITLEQTSTTYKKNWQDYYEKGYNIDRFGYNTPETYMIQAKGDKRIGFDHIWYDSLDEVLYVLIHHCHIPLYNLNVFNPTDNKYDYEPGWYANVYDETNRKVEFYLCKNTTINFWSHFDSNLSWKSRSARYKYTARGYEWYKWPKNKSAHDVGHPMWRNKFQTYQQGIRQNAALEYDYLEAKEYVPNIRKWKSLNRVSGWIEDRDSGMYSRNPRSWKNQKIKHQWEKHLRQK